MGFNKYLNYKWIELRLCLCVYVVLLNEGEPLTLFGL
jgi:hypothetical protein